YQIASSAISKLGISLKNKLNLQEASFDQFMVAIQTLAKKKNDLAPIVFMARQYLDAVVKPQQVPTNAKNKMKILEGIAPVIAESKGSLIFSQTVDSSSQAAHVLQRAGIETKAVSSASMPHERRGAMQQLANVFAKDVCSPGHICVRNVDLASDIYDA